ncbi:MAG: UPF0104 family protein [Chlorobi bacterium CHB1]|nr:UPF0104 family protein [Chlorobi bacterium CHB1]
MRLVLVLSLGLLITAIYSACTIDQQAFEALRHFPLHYALLLLAMALLPWFTSTIRLSVWMTFLKHPVRFNELFRIILAADAVAAVTPTAVGGGYFKFGWLIKRGVPAGPAASLMILGTLEEYAFFLISIPVVFWFSPAARGVFIEIWNKLPAGTLRGEEVFSYVVLPLIGMALAGQLMWRFMNEAHKTRLRNFWRGVRRQAKLGFDTLWMVAAKGGWRFAVTVGLAGVHWVCRCSLLVILLEGLRQQLDAMSVIISQWLLFMLMNFMPSPGAVGGAEFGFSTRLIMSMILVSRLSLTCTGSLPTSFSPNIPQYFVQSLYRSVACDHNNTKGRCEFETESSLESFVPILPLSCQGEEHR